MTWARGPAHGRRKQPCAADPAYVKQGRRRRARPPRPLPKTTSHPRAAVSRLKLDEAHARLCFFSLSFSSRASFPFVHYYYCLFHDQPNIPPFFLPCSTASHHQPTQAPWRPASPFCIFCVYTYLVACVYLWANTKHGNTHGARRWLASCFGFAL